MIREKYDRNFLKVLFFENPDGFRTAILPALVKEYKNKIENKC